MHGLFHADTLPLLTYQRKARYVYLRLNMKRKFLHKSSEVNVERGHVKP